MSRLTLLTRVSSFLSSHLRRLGHALNAQRQRLREAVAMAVGQTVAVAVHQAVQSALTPDMAEPVVPRSPVWSPSPSASLWEEPDDTQRHALPEEFLAAPDDEDVDDGPQEDSAEPSQSKVIRWRLALAVGCEALAWCLRQAQQPMGAAVAITTVVTAIAYFAGAAFASSVLSLISLVHTVASAAIALARMTRS